MKHILSIYLLLLAVSVSAQTNENVEVLPKGMKFIGGDTYLYIDKSTSEAGVQNSASKNSYFNIGPVAGKYVKENLALGLGLGYGYSKNKYEYSDNSKSESQGQSVYANFFLRKNYKIVPNLFFFCRQVQR